MLAYIIHLMMTSNDRCSKYVSSCFWQNDKPVRDSRNSRFYMVLWGTMISIQNYFEILIRRTALKISTCVYCKRFRANDLGQTIWAVMINGWESYSSAKHLTAVGWRTKYGIIRKCSSVFYMTFYLVITKRLRKWFERR